MNRESALRTSAELGGLTDRRLREVFRLMYTIRRFEVTTERAHLDGDLYGPFHSSMGQEAVSVVAVTV